MNIALQKSVVFLLLILLGVLLKKKMGGGSETNSLKVLILNVALPATVFIALLKIEVDSNFLFLPFIALVFNVLLWYATSLFLKLGKIDPNGSQGKTLKMLLPSFAPGLSTFAIISEFLGEKYLAMAAFADVGNKIFVLIVMYLISMQWYYQITEQKAVDFAQRWVRVKQLLKALVQEPINIAVVIALSMVFLGFNLSVLPFFFKESVEKLAVIMTPLVLIFIGLSVKLKKSSIVLLLQSIIWRSGITFVISAIFITLMPANMPTSIILLMVILPQSACSFWPYAHMAIVSELQSKSDHPKIFRLDMALNLLALSLPFATILSLIICSSGNVFTNSANILFLGFSLVALSITPFLIKSFQVIRRSIRLYKIKTVTS
jgi:malate permease and related proteins